MTRSLCLRSVEFAPRLLLGYALAASAAVFAESPEPPLQLWGDGGRYAFGVDHVRREAELLLEGGEREEQFSIGKLTVVDVRARYNPEYGIPLLSHCEATTHKGLETGDGFLLIEAVYHFKPDKMALIPCTTFTFDRARKKIMVQFERVVITRQGAGKEVSLQLKHFVASELAKGINLNFSDLEDPNLFTQNEVAKAMHANATPPYEREFESTLKLMATFDATNGLKSTPPVPQAQTVGAGESGGQK